MSQRIFSDINPDTTTGLMLSALLDDFKDAIMSGFSGTSRPANLRTGGTWIDTANQGAPNYYWALKVFTGTTDIELVRISLLTGTSGATLALDTMSIRRIEDDNVAAVLNFVKNRVANSGQVLAGDTVAELRMIGRTDSGTDPVVAYIRATADDNMTSSQRGSIFALGSTALGTNTITDYLRFLDGTTEAVTPLKINAVAYEYESATSSTDMILSSDRIVSNLTGTTAATVHGIEQEASKYKIILNNTSQNITFKHESLTAIGEERFSLPGNTDITISPNGTATFFFSDTLDRWIFLQGAVKTIVRSLEVYRHGYTDWVAPLTGMLHVTAISDDSQGVTSADSSGSALITPNKDAFTWGLNTNGQLGVGDIISRSSPTLVLGNIKFRKINRQISSFGIDENDIGYAWGVNTKGQLGDGTTISKSSPVLIAGSLRFAKILNLQNSVISLTMDGRVFCWGDNVNGQIGDNTVVAKSSPVAVVGTRYFSEIYAQENASTTPSNSFFALEASTGYLFAWGDNTNGQLGDGSTVAKSSPVAVLGSAVLRKAAIGNNFVVALTKTGDLIAWGVNASGQLGDGSTVAKSSPVSISGGLKFKDVVVIDSSVFAITNDGSLYSWGENVEGQLGLGDNINKSSPTLVGNKKWDMVTGFSGAFAAIEKATGTLYTWGSANLERLGTGGGAVSSPVAVVGAIKFSDVKIFGDWALGYSGTSVYTWGLNANGQLVNGGTTTVSSPTILNLYQVPMTDKRFVRSAFIPVTLGRTYRIKLSSAGSSFGGYSLGVGAKRIYLGYEN